ncbi:MAG TPA: glycoside hydrolase family 88 protein, partial [Phnomibacter sp.]|nr:glycoside hydrolase family 88 protein [Phnomibacter sp.]
MKPFILGLCLIGSLMAVAQKKSSKNLSPDSIMHLMERVANWQINEFAEKRNQWPTTDWTNGALYAGLMELALLNNSGGHYEDFLIKIGNQNNWNTGRRRLFADDYCVGQLYAQLYMQKKEPHMIEKFVHLADTIVQKPFTESLEWKNNIQLREWAWCDALFMGPPALAYLSTATQNLAYLQKADTLWWKTTSYLYDTKEHLYFRDSKYFNQREANGKKMFWARGNGWVMGGLVRMLQNQPATFENRSRYEKLLKQMAAKIARLQHKDGTWHAALLDQQSYPAMETSGTGFYTYALTWGVRQGLLSKAKYMPVITKAWQALSAAVHPNGMLGFVQKIGEKPGNTDMESTEVYGVGAFLLAGSEVY